MSDINSFSSIEHWLHTVASSTGQIEKTRPRHKRKRRHNHFITPPDSMADRTPRKRARAYADGVDDDEDTDELDEPGVTPRAIAQPRSVSHSRSRSNASSPLKASQASSPSKTSQGRKMMANIGLGSNAVKMRSLSLSKQDELPTTLFELLQELENVVSGNSVVSEALEPSFHAYAPEPLVQQRPPSFFADSKQRDKIGVTPPLDEVLIIIREAIRCEDKRLDEAAWNAAVHFPILRLAVFGQHRRRKQLVDIECCTTANIIREYHKQAIMTTKRVDFVMYLEPSEAVLGTSAAEDRIEAIREGLDSGSINHSDYYGLLANPLAVSIETKRSNQGVDNATMQTGIWHAAHWSLLAWQTNNKPEVLAELPFLPGVIVVGHEWTLAASTRKAGKTILWFGFPIGTTKTVPGTYAIMYALQRLENWAREVYWPWYARAVLDIST